MWRLYSAKIYLKGFKPFKYQAAKLRLRLLKKGATEKFKGFSCCVFVKGYAYVKLLKTT